MGKWDRDRVCSLAGGLDTPLGCPVTPGGCGEPMGRDARGSI